MDKYIVKKRKKLRYGFTTGSCAAAAAKAAVKMLFTGKEIEHIDIDTPKGWKLNLEVEDVKLTNEFVSCAITKDSGDDPDITNGIKVYAKVQAIESNIVVTGGKGVGVVTKKGLSVEVGNPAINPVPMEMIKTEVSKVLPENKGVKIEISVPKGEEIAKKTFNPKLGIIGGISIIGTSGIVEPMSEEALKDSLALELPIMKENNCDEIIFCSGNYGQDFVKNNGLNADRIVKTSNFIGFMLDKALEVGIKKIFIVGHIGKFIKVAGGIFHTHSSVADARMEILAANCAMLGAPKALIEKIMNSITTEEAVEYIYEYNFEAVFDIIAQKISDRCKTRVYDEIEIGCLIFSQNKGQLGICKKGKKLLEDFKDE